MMEPPEPEKTSIDVRLAHYRDVLVTQGNLKPEEFDNIVNAFGDVELALITLALMFRHTPTDRTCHYSATLTARRQLRRQLRPHR
jgi:hypothetical protein